MQAIVKARPSYGVEVREVHQSELGADDVRIEVQAAAICGADLKLYKWDPKVVQSWHRLRDMKLPHVIGHEVAGVVVETGSQVINGVKVGDRVALETHFSCGHCRLCTTNRMHLCTNRKILGFDTPGGFARYVVVPERCAVPVPDELSMEAAALCEPFGIAVHAVEEADPLDVACAWVLGCGPIGLFIIKLLAVMGVKKIFATDTQPSRLHLAQNLGAEAIAASDGICAQIKAATDGLGADLVIEAVGSPATVQQALDSVAPCGRVILVGTFGGQTSIDVANQLIYREVTVRGVYGRHMFKTWDSIRQLVKSGAIDLESFITHRFGFSQATQAFETAIAGDGIKTILVPDES